MHVVGTSFDDPGPQGQGRYMGQMAPEIMRSDWRKGAQVVACDSLSSDSLVRCIVLFKNTSSALFNCIKKVLFSLFFIVYVQATHP